mgnify:CR=1 FL=1
MSRTSPATVGYGTSDAPTRTLGLPSVAPHPFWEKLVDFPRRAFEEAAVDTLVIKCRRAVEQTGHKRLVMAGGVSANQSLRAKLAEQMKKRGVDVYYPAPQYCTDNGAMIAFAGALRLQAGEQAELPIKIRPRWPLTELASL